MDGVINHNKHSRVMCSEKNCGNMFADVNTSEQHKVEFHSKYDILYFIFLRILVNYMLMNSGNLITLRHQEGEEEKTGSLDIMFL